MIPSISAMSPNPSPAMSFAGRTERRVAERAAKKKKKGEEGKKTAPKTTTPGFFSSQTLTPEKQYERFSTATRALEAYFRTQRYNPNSPGLEKLCREVRDAQNQPAVIAKIRTKIFGLTSPTHIVAQESHASCNFTAKESAGTYGFNSCLGGIFIPPPSSGVVVGGMSHFMGVSHPARNRLIGKFTDRATPQGTSNLFLYQPDQADNNVDLQAQASVDAILHTLREKGLKEGKNLQVWRFKYPILYAANLTELKANPRTLIAEPEVVPPGQTPRFVSVSDSLDVIPKDFKIPLL